MAIRCTLAQLNAQDVALSDELQGSMPSTAGSCRMLDATQRVQDPLQLHCKPLQMYCSQITQISDPVNPGYQCWDVLGVERYQMLCILGHVHGITSLQLLGYLLG